MPGGWGSVLSYSSIAIVFDMVSHEKLLNIMSRIGFRGSCSIGALPILDIKVSGFFTSVGTINLEVPQGSVLGLLCSYSISTLSFMLD